VALADSVVRNASRWQKKLDKRRNKQTNMQAYFVRYHTFVIHSGLAKREKYTFGY